MLFTTLLNKIEKFKSFVYKKAQLFVTGELYSLDKEPLMGDPPYACTLREDIKC